MYLINVILSVLIMDFDVGSVVMISINLNVMYGLCKMFCFEVLLKCCVMWVLMVR